MPGFCAAETIPNSIVSLILFFSRLFFFLFPKVVGARYRKHRKLQTRKRTLKTTIIPAMQSNSLVSVFL